MTTYIGRFAPSPSGPLHFGSLVAALASYLDARSNDGKWLVRIEDIDKPRCPAPNDQLILKSLEAFGFEWDGPVVYQTQRLERYQGILEQFINEGLVYPCNCNRKRLLPLEGSYDGHCLTTPPDKNDSVSYRLKQTQKPTTIYDRLQNPIVPTKSDNSDYIIKRKDGLFAYQLVVVVDDMDQQMTHVVRGADILETTVRQSMLHQQFKNPVPQWLHIPVLVTSPGQKLSKQNHAAPIDNYNPGPQLVAALKCLGQQIENELAFEEPSTILQYAWNNWDIARITNATEIEFC